MGLSPQDVKRETPADLWSAFLGWRAFHARGGGDDIDDDEFLQVLAAEQAAGRA